MPNQTITPVIKLQRKASTYFLCMKRIKINIWNIAERHSAKIWRFNSENKIKISSNVWSHQSKVFGWAQFIACWYKSLSWRIIVSMRLPSIIFSVVFCVEFDGRAAVKALCMCRSLSDFLYLMFPNDGTFERIIPFANLCGLHLTVTTRPETPGITKCVRTVWR